MSIGIDRNRELLVEFEPFDRPMGIAYANGHLCVASKNQVWLLAEDKSIAKQISSDRDYDSVFLARRSYWTGDVQAHEVGWAFDDWIFVNTAFSCLCRPHSHYSFLPLWRPPFVTELAAEDRCHLNGVAIADNEALFATVLAECNHANGWRKDKARTGAVLSLPEGEPVARELCMPHSPRIHAGELWVLNSGFGQLLRIEAFSGLTQVVELVPGYARGLAFMGEYAFVGLSKIRERAIFGDLPLSHYRDQLRCGIAVIHLPSGKTCATFQFLKGIEEVFDIAIVPETTSVFISGPDGRAKDSPIWLVPNG